MEEFKSICFWLIVLVLWCGCCFIETKAKGQIRVENANNISNTVFHHEVQYQEGPKSVVYTLSGNHAPCVFPFIYHGRKFTECTTYAGTRRRHNKLWCATTSNFDKDEKWGNCQTDNDVTNCMDRHGQCGDWARSGECVVHAPYMRQECPRSCGLCTFGGNGKRRACKFPFFFKDKLVYDCLPFNKKTWCSTTTNFKKDKRWGYCFPKLFRDIKAVNRKYMYLGECDDRSTKCLSWAKEGLCEKQPKRMTSWCAWSCHKCAQELMVLQKGCKDHSSSCKAWAKSGHCENRALFMHAFCRWTCKRCAKRSLSPTVRDRMQSCREWARNGDCYRHQEFMLQNCRKSCKAGGKVNGRTCYDDVADCNRLAKSGYCGKLTTRDIMRKYCHFSCKSC